MRMQFSGERQFTVSPVNVWPSWVTSMVTVTMTSSLLHPMATCATKRGSLPAARTAWRRDVNGDGRDDLIIGSYGNDETAFMAGKVYLLLGRATANWGGT
ncbi:MAG: hypothetical protein FJ026_17005 [Chloroflexi bacterium]|nr:hypothetical protein [Chloroflexota bacterium]